MAKAKKELDSELNLIAFISLLSVLICSLLLTAIWVQIGSINVKQAIGGQASTSKEKIPTLWAYVLRDKTIKFELQDAPRKANALRRKNIKPVDGQLNEEAFEKYLSTVKAKVPNLRTALIKPKAETLYEDIILLMDVFKKQGIVDLGVTPL